MTAVRHFKRTAGKTPIPVIITVRCKCRGKKVPMNKILCFSMAPVHRPPADIIRIILEKEMGFPVIKCESIRIVNPARPACEMIDRPQAFRFTALFPLVTACLAKHLFSHHVLPQTQRCCQSSKGSHIRAGTACLHRMALP